MGNLAAQLCATGCTGTAHECAVLIPLHLCSTDRTAAGKPIDRSIRRALLLDHIQDLRNNLTGLANANRIPDADIALGDEVLIVQRCIGHGSAGQPHRTHHSLGGQNTGSAHLNDDVLHDSFLDFGRIFIGSCPAGEFRGSAQSLSLGKIVDLNDSAVDIAGQLTTVFIDGKNVIVNFLYAAQLLIGNHFQAKRFQVVECFRMARKLHTLTQLDIEDEDIESPLCADLRIQLPQRAGSGISGVCKERFPLLFLPGVELFKALLRHIHLTTHNQPWRCVFNGHGDGTDGFQILRYIFTHIAVTAGSTTDEFTIHTWT